MSSAWARRIARASRWVIATYTTTAAAIQAAKSLDLALVPGSESFLFQSAISGKNATISPRISATGGFRCQKRGPLRPTLEEEPYAEGLDDGERQRRHRRCGRPHPAGPVPARGPAAHRHARRLRHLAMRRLRGASGWQGGEGLHDVCLGSRGQERAHHRRAGAEWQTA